MSSKSSCFGTHTTVSARTTASGARLRVRTFTMVLLAAGLLGGSPLLPGAAAADTGTLKLMVTNCSSVPCDGGFVEVEIYRAGSGVVATDDGYTDEGYIEFTFTMLEGGDHARVSVSGCGLSERVHTYVWVSDNGDRPAFWDVLTTIPNSPCRDSWWDEEENIIQCKCD
jgi:hypothetical protein